MAQTVSRPGDRVPPLQKPKRQWPFPLSIYQSAVGRKWVMALTGIGLLGFVLVHMIGNLHVYEGPAKMHEYAEALRDLGGGILPRTLLLWVMRVGLIAMFAIHIHAAVTLSLMSKKAEGHKYEGGRDYIAANYASRTMRWTGPIIALFILFHLADLTWGWWLGDDYIRGNPYHNITESLGNLPVAIIYIVANVALALHLFHGIFSLFQSMGVNNPRYNQLRRGLAVGFAGIILIGNLSFPILTQAGVINEDNVQCDPADLICLQEQLEGEEASP